MPFFEITVNDEPRTIVGNDDIDFLTLGVISAQISQYAYLQVTSMNKAVGQVETLLNRQLAPDSFLVVTFQGTRRPVENMARQSSLARAPFVDTSSKRTGRVGFAVRVNNSGLVSASVDDDSSLQVEATWTKVRNRCLFNLACIRMTTEGQNQMLMEHDILAGQPFSIQVV